MENEDGRRQIRSTKYDLMESRLSSCTLTQNFDSMKLKRRKGNMLLVHRKLKK